MIHDLQFRLNLLQQKRMNIATTGMVLADGQISMSEAQQSNFYVQNGLAGVIGMANGMTQQYAPMYGQQGVMAQRDMQGNISIHEKVKQQAAAQLASQEKVLDQQSEQIQTKLKMYQSELDEVKKMEDQSIKMMTPKYVA